MTSSNLKKLLKKYGLHIEFAPIEREGYLAGNIVIVNDNATDDEIENVILHEVGHAKNDPTIVGSYQELGSAHACSEHGANAYMIAERVREYVALGNDPNLANYVDIAINLGLKDYEEVKKELMKYTNSTY